MENLKFNTETVYRATLSINRLIETTRTVMIDDIRTALENSEDFMIELIEPVYLNYTENDSCYAVWLEEDDIVFGFNSLYMTKRNIEYIDFQLLSNVYTTMENEGWFNSNNYTEE